jgi:putative tricarboxylic transport membrane protein
MPAPDHSPAARPSWAGPRATGIGLLALGVTALLATAAIPAGRDGWSTTGARFFPLLVSIGLILLALANLARATLWPDRELGEHAAQEAGETDWRVPALLAAALVGYVLLLEPVGYVVTTALFLPVAARVLGSGKPVRDVLSGIAFAVVVDALFTQLLAVPLPTGIAGL